MRYNPWNHSISCIHKGTTCQEHQWAVDQCLPFTALRKISNGGHAATDVRWDNALPMLPLTHVCLQERQKETSLLMYWLTLPCVLNMLAWIRAAVWVHVPGWCLMRARRWLHHHKSCRSCSIHAASHFTSQTSLPTYTLLDYRWEEKETHRKFCSYGKMLKDIHHWGNRESPQLIIEFHAKFQSYCFEFTWLYNLFPLPQSLQSDKGQIFLFPNLEFYFSKEKWLSRLRQKISII